MSVTLLIPLPDYLRQWCSYAFDGVSPVRFPNGSAENAVLKAFIRRRRATDPPPLTDAPGYLKIVLPDFKGMPSEYFNVLPPKGVDTLISVISARFDVQLFADVFPLVGIADIDKSIWA